MARFHGANSSSSAFASFRSRVSNPYVNFSQSTALRVVRLPSHRVLDNSNPAVRTSTGSFAMLARDPPRFIAREQVSSRAPRQGTPSQCHRFDDMNERAEACRRKPIPAPVARDTALDAHTAADFRSV